MVAAKNIFPMLNKDTFVYLHICFPAREPKAMPIKNKANVKENDCGIDMPTKEIILTHKISIARQENPLKNEIK